MAWGDGDVGGEEDEHFGLLLLEGWDCGMVEWWEGIGWWVKGRYGEAGC